MVCYRVLTMSIKQRLAAAGLSASLILAGGTLIAPFEGMRTKAYKDIVGVWTQCYGDTNHVTRNKEKTEDECGDELAQQVVTYNTIMKKYIHVPLTTGQDAAFTSAVYNFGETTWRKSSMVRLANEGKMTEACAYLMQYTKAGGKVVKGLVTRRKAEMEVCLGNNQQAIQEAERIYAQFKDSDTIEVKEQ